MAQQGEPGASDWAPCTIIPRQAHPQPMCSVGRVWGWLAQLAIGWGATLETGSAQIVPTRPMHAGAKCGAIGAAGEQNTPVQQAPIQIEPDQGALSDVEVGSLWHPLSLIGQPGHGSMGSQAQAARRVAR